MILDAVKKIKETLATPGWKYIEQILQTTLNENIEIVKREHKDIAKLMYAQAIIQIIENIYSELNLIEHKGKEEIELFKKYKKGG